jgi:hypothetical protein
VLNILKFKIRDILLEILSFASQSPLPSGPKPCIMNPTPGRTLDRPKGRGGKKP